MTGGGWARRKHSTVAVERSEAAEVPFSPLQVVALPAMIDVDHEGTDMVRTTSWDRGYMENLSFDGTTSNFHGVLRTLAPGETLQRVIITQDIALSMTNAVDTDVGICCPYGIHADTSNVSPSIDPYADPASTNPRWLYWDQALFRFEYFQAGTPDIWSSRNDDRSRHFDTPANIRNDTASNLYIWWSWAPSTFLNWVTAGMQAFGSMSYQTLVLSA